MMFRESDYKQILRHLPINKHYQATELLFILVLTGQPDYRSSIATQLIWEFKIYKEMVAKTSLKIASSSFSISFIVMSVCFTFES